jgi:hypothetical protein
MTTEKQRPHRFEVRFTVDEFMGPIYTRLNGLPAKFRHREALSAARAYYDGRVQASTVAGILAAETADIKPAQQRQVVKTMHAEGVAAVRGLDALVDAVPEAMLEGPPGAIH